MPYHNSPPVVDDKNPLYDPTCPANSFAFSLHRKLESYPHSPFSETGKLEYSFAKVLDQALFSRAEAAGDDFPLISAEWVPNDEVLLAHTQFNSGPVRVCPAGSHSTTVPNIQVYAPTFGLGSDFSAIDGPQRNERSIQSFHESSFDLSVQAERLNYSAGLTSTVDAHISSDDGRRLTQLTPQAKMRKSHVGRGESLLSRIGELLPGMRMLDWFGDDEHPSPQKICNRLAFQGLLSPQILGLLRALDVHRLSLGPSMAEQGGLNLSGADLLPVFGKPDSFVHLLELSITDVQINDFDLIHIHHLPRLASLYLDETNIGNEGVFLLTSLKQTLVNLSVSYNPRIDDDAVPALLVLSNLEYLSLIDTGIGMPGLRRIATRGRTINIEIPASCERYLDSLRMKYILYPVPPLISDPSECSKLSLVEVKRNLRAHAECDPRIVTSGSRAEMIGRLREILKTRAEDLAVRDMLWNGRAEEEILD